MLDLAKSILYHVVVKLLLAVQTSLMILVVVAACQPITYGEVVWEVSEALCEKMVECGAISTSVDTCTSDSHARICDSLQGGCDEAMPRGTSIDIERCVEAIDLLTCAGVVPPRCVSLMSNPPKKGGLL